ncbi:fimbrial protein [Aeromonas jandaei]|uniref:fimbrial protein n=1 Tax=Aeromonas jandaei TaxID=650 RepID=UPI003BA353DB
MMMLTKNELLWTLLVAGLACYPWQAKAACRVEGDPAMTMSYDYQRDRAVGSIEPIATVTFETQLRCDGESSGQLPMLEMGQAGRSYNARTVPGIGEVNLLSGNTDSVGFSWNNKVNGQKRSVAFNGQPIRRTLTGEVDTIHVQDSFKFYYVAGALQPGRDIAPAPIPVSYQGELLYTLEFPAIPLFARACTVKTERLDIDFGKVEMNQILSAELPPLPEMVRSQPIELECDPGTNVGFRVTNAKQQFGTTLLTSETLDSSAKGVGVKMRYISLARTSKEVRFGETMSWGRTAETRYGANQFVTLPFEFYLVKTESDIKPGLFTAEATIEMRHE